MRTHTHTHTCAHVCTHTRVRTRARAAQRAKGPRIGSHWGVIKLKVALVTSLYGTHTFVTACTRTMHTCKTAFYAYTLSCAACTRTTHMHHARILVCQHTHIYTNLQFRCLPSVAVLLLLLLLLLLLHLCLRVAGIMFRVWCLKLRRQVYTLLPIPYAGNQVFQITKEAVVVLWIAGGTFLCTCMCVCVTTLIGKNKCLDSVHGPFVDAAIPSGLRRDLSILNFASGWFNREQAEWAMMGSDLLSLRLEPKPALPPYACNVSKLTLKGRALPPFACNVSKLTLKGRALQLTTGQL